jgi:hypothetical protein
MKLKTKIFMVAAIGAAGVVLAALRAHSGAPGPLATNHRSQPAPSQEQVLADLERRASDAFDSSQYATALPLLQQLSLKLRDYPNRRATVEARIRVCQRNLADLAISAYPAPWDSTGPREPHQPLQPGEVRDIEIQDLGNFDYDAGGGGKIPDDVLALNGGKFRLVGFMIPLDQADSVTEFVLVPTLGTCCFGQPPAVQHTVIVQCAPGTPVQYTSLSILVEGTLHVAENKEDGYVISLFTLDNAHQVHIGE